MSKLFGLSPSTIKSVIWISAIILLNLILQMFWSNNNTSCQYTICRFLINSLFLQRGLLEVYRCFYNSEAPSSNIFSNPTTPTPMCGNDGSYQSTLNTTSFSSDSSASSSSSNSSSSKIFRGRAALWIRLILSLILVVTAFVAFVEGSSTVFEFEVTPTTSKKKNLNNNDNKVNTNINNDEIEDHRVIRHSSIVDAPRSKKTSNDNQKMNRNAFSPGAVDAYSLMLHTEPLCPKLSSFVAPILTWIIHCVASFVCHFVDNNSSSSKNSSSSFRNNMMQHQNEKDKKIDSPNHNNFDVDNNNNNDDENYNNKLRTIWALQYDTFTELKLASNICFFTLLLNYAAHLWSLDPVEELPAYLSFVTAAWVLYFEYHSNLPILRAVTLSLTQSEAQMISNVEKQLAKSLSESEFSVNRIRAFKSQHGTLRLLIDAENHFHDDAMKEKEKEHQQQGKEEEEEKLSVFVGDSNKLEEEIKIVLKMNPVWERMIEAHSMQVRIVS